MKNNKIEPYKAITIYRKSSFTALLIVICTAINAQTGFINRDSEFLNINTPNVASFTKFIDNPIDLYHGTPDVSIPIDTLKDGDIELPITLRYNTSGIKVQEQASWVGLGWNLNMGGVIVQNIVGDYDGNDDSFNEVLPLLNISTPFSGYYAPTNPVAWHESFIHGEYLERQVQGSYIRRDLGKLNPDVFSFSYPGGAGKFVFDYRTSPYEIYILDRTEAIKIEVTNGNGSVPTWIAIKGFQITTPDGIRHLFRYQSNMMSIYQMNITDGNPVSISYALYQSIYPNGQTVNYTYDNYLAYEYNYSQMVVKFDSHTGNIIGTSRVRYNWDYVKGNDFYLTSISTTNYNINFNTIDRDDVYCNAKALQSISIASQSQTNVKLKEFGFTYEYFEANPNSKGWQPTANGFYPDPSWNTDYDYKRLKLKNIYEKNGTQTNNKYEFEYDETYQLPAKSSYFMDYWGYCNYNGVNGGTSRPSYLPDFQQVFSLGVYEYGHRDYNFNYCKAGMLKKIIYPTKGYREFTYEPNSFMNATGLPIETQYTTYSGSDYNNPAGSSVSVPFTIPDNCTAELEIVMERGLNSWINMQGSKVTLLKASTIIADHHFTYDYYIGHYANHLPNEGQMKIVQTLSLTSGTYNLKIDLTNNLPNQYGASTNHGCLRAKITIPITNPPAQETQGCGLRIKRIVANDLTKTETTEFEYKIPVPNVSISSGILQEILSFHRVNYSHLRYVNCNCFWSNECFDVVSCSVYQDERYRPALEISSSNLAYNPYATTGGVGYSYVKVIQKSTSNTNDNGFVMYKYANTSPTFADNSVRIDHPMNGKLLSMETYKNNGNI